tara:strand:- start:189 stop:1574 length:1386 start_codon:yes stop_codon:yes gene_type:complete
MNNFYCYLSIESPSRLGSIQATDTRYPIKINIVSRAENRKRAVKKVTYPDGKPVVCAPEVFKACWPEYSKNKNVLQNAKMLSIRGNNKKLKDVVDAFKKRWEDLIDEVNTTNKNSYSFLWDIMEHMKRNDAPVTNLNINAKQYSIEYVFAKYCIWKNHSKSSTINSYNDAYMNLRKYCIERAQGPETSIFKITPYFLKKYEKWNLDIGNSRKSVQSYMSRLQAVLNMCVYKVEFYDSSRLPFGNKNAGKYSVPKVARQVNLFLDEKQIETFRNYVPKSDEQQRAKDIWFLMYYLGGCNPNDLIFSFRKKSYDKEKGTLVYERLKTIDTILVKKTMPVTVMDDGKKLVDKYSDLKGIKKEHIQLEHRLGNLFPFEHMYGKNPLRNLRVRTNKYLAQMNDELGFEKLLCSMARHSCFNKLRSEGASITQIMEVAGHESERTTRLYLEKLTGTKLKGVYDKLYK